MGYQQAIDNCRFRGSISKTNISSNAVTGGIVGIKSGGRISVAAQMKVPSLEQPQELEVVKQI